MTKESLRNSVLDGHSGEGSGWFHKEQRWPLGFM